MGAIITEMHYCLAPGRLSHEDLAEQFDPKQLNSIEKMSGIHSRRVVVPGVTALDLAEVAVRKLLAEGNTGIDEIDLLVFVTQTPEHQIPATACELHGRLGCVQSCAAFDLNLGCSAFPYALAVVSSMLKSGVARTALLCHADTVSTVVGPEDRGLKPLHGDAASVCILRDNASAVGIHGFELGTHGQSSHEIMMSEPLRANVGSSGEGLPRLCMNGPAVFHFSIEKIPAVIQTYLSKQSLTIEDMELVLLHQANKTMVDLIYRALNVPKEKRFYFMEDVGNLAGASTPVLLNEAWRQGAISPGDRVLVASFGNGLSWGVSSLVWPDGIPPANMSSVEYDASLVSRGEKS